MNARAHCAAAISTLADTRAAAEDVAARVRDGLAGAPADLAFLFLSPEHVTDAEDAAAAVASVLEPGALAGSTGEAVIGTARELDGRPEPRGERFDLVARRPPVPALQRLHARRCFDQSLTHRRRLGT